MVQPCGIRDLQVSARGPGLAKDESESINLLTCMTVSLLLSLASTMQGQARSWKFLLVLEVKWKSFLIRRCSILQRYGHISSTNNHIDSLGHIWCTIRGVCRIYKSGDHLEDPIFHPMQGIVMLRKAGLKGLITFFLVPKEVDRWVREFVVSAQVQKSL